MTTVAAYLSLFLVAFGAATILPFQSEPLLVGLIASGQFSLLGLIVVASIGNILGAVCNWVLGRFIDRFHDRSWFPVKEASLKRASDWYRRYGRWTLLLSWMPLFGDALTVIAGVLREPPVVFPDTRHTRKNGQIHCPRGGHPWHDGRPSVLIPSTTKGPGTFF
jgi:membrane protein YqaA with SNARE-associated domain